MPFFRRLWLVAFAGLLLTGCPTPPKPQPRVTPIVGLIPSPSPAPIVAPETPAELIMRGHWLPSDRQSIWVPWQTLAEKHGWNPARVLGNAWPPLLELRASNEVFHVTVGERNAAWNGMALSLGYGPRVISGLVSIHRLDLEKNFEPLLLRPSLPNRTGRKIMIDPGHGGLNWGARSIADGRLEKDFALDWAFRLRPLLMGQGWEVFFTRTNDVDVPLPERVIMADRVQADLFLSLHFNSTTGSLATEQSGIETYCLTPVGLPSTLTRDYEDDPTKPYPNNVFDFENVRYAARIHRALIEGLRCKDRGVRRARFMAVLRAQQRPAVLLEGGFLSNPAEANRIGSVEYRQLLASAVARALTD